MNAFLRLATSASIVAVFALSPLRAADKSTEAAPAPSPARFESAPMKVNDDKFLVYKITRGPNYDLVLGGDSRVMMGVSATSMKNVIPDLRPFNFAFRALVWTNEYCRVMKSLLDPNSSRRIIVMGLSPISLTRNAKDNNDFTTAMQMRPDVSSRLAGLRKRIEDSMRPLRHVDRDPLPENVKRYYHDDGWVGTERPNEGAKKGLKRQFGGTTMDRELVRELMESVKSMSDEGIHVYGYRPPTSSGIYDMEKSVLKFDEENFKRMFEQAGGTWLKIKQEGLTCTDGHHLDIPSAVRFTERLTIAIRDSEKARK